MRLSYLFLTCCLLVSTLVVAQEEASAVSSVISKIPSGVVGGGFFGDTIKIEKEFQLEAKDIIVNVGKVDIEIEKEIKKFPLIGAAGAVEAAQQTNLLLPNKVELEKEIDIETKDIIVNIGKVKVDIEKEKNLGLLAAADADAEDAQVAGNAQLIPIIPKNKIDIEKEIDIETKDIIVNIGKVKVDIEKKKKFGLLAAADANAEDAEDAEVAGNAQLIPIIPKNKIDIEKEIDIETKDIIVNIGKVKVEIEKEKKFPTWPWKAIGKPAYKFPSIGATGDENGQVYDDNTTIPLFEEFTPTDEPDATETVLGENATAVTVQGGEKFDERGVLILTGPQIYSVTFKIVKEKVITIAGSDVDVAGKKKHQPREAVTFIIRGRGFVPGGSLFHELSDFVEGGGTSKGGLFEFLEPRVFLGAIPLKVVKFTDTLIIARFLDVEDQRDFLPGTLLARVKVLHVDLKKEKKKHGPGGDIDIFGDVITVPNGFPAVIAALNQKSLFHHSDTITSPVLGVIENPFDQGEKKVDHPHQHENKKNDFSTSLLGLFAGLKFDTAVLQVQFSVKDAEKIKGAYSTLYTGYGLDM